MIVLIVKTIPIVFGDNRSRSSLLYLWKFILGNNWCHTAFIYHRLIEIIMWVILIGFGVNRSKVKVIITSSFELYFRQWMAFHKLSLQISDCFCNITRDHSTHWVKVNVTLFIFASFTTCIGGRHALFPKANSSFICILVCAFLFSIIYFFFCLHSFFQSPWIYSVMY